MNYIRLQTNLIFEISTKNSVDRYVFEIFARGPPQGYMKK